MEDIRLPNMELWPENVAAINLFCSISSQFRNGPGGPTGLDYNVVFHELDRAKLPPDEYDDLLWCIRAIEHAALDEMHKD